MTAGTITKDQRVSISGYCGTALVGSYFQKTWSGGDRTVSVQAKAPRAPDVAYHATRFRHDGTPYAAIIHRPAPPPRPPRRASPNVDHSYSVTIIDKFNPAIGIRDPNNQPNLIRPGSVETCLGLVFTNQARWSSNDDLKLLQKLREELIGSDFNAGVFLGTAHQSLATIADSAFRIAKAYSAVKKGNFPAALKALGISKPAARLRHTSTAKNVSDNWLALQYGWLPMLQDTKSAAEFVAHQVNVPFRHSYRVRRSLDKIPITPIGNAGQFISSQLIESGQIIARFSERPNVFKLSNITDPLSVAWELAPWSFVVDWFVPIGDWLEVRSSLNGLVGSFVTTRRTIHRVVGVKPKPSPYIYSGPYESARHTTVSITRTVSTSLNVPLPKVKPLGSVPSWRRAANAVALLVQKI